ncbi:MAM and LDL-receptor class A domain-containing protein 1 [Aplysia californica]|uniref:MAM and LDL-receptor class A domain-containing protein 1 n=1 Tax=Aplysia californica TaxID=6500 RepID=A0ABM0JE42_APLCA|nr:MAM and LDL-receptor class A domain-containing protein 1 [Aplysia californica]
MNVLLTAWAILVVYFMSHSVNAENRIGCNFEVDLCGWTQNTDDDYDWRRNSGPTPSFSTGPSGDHTLGSASGAYIYTEASFGIAGETAKLTSDRVTLSSGDGCFQLWYNMYGAGIGALNVYLMPSDGPLKSLVSLEGEQGRDWRMLSVNISSTDFRIVLEGVRGKSFMGDIAVDDVRLTDRPCGDPQLVG